MREIIVTIDTKGNTQVTTKGFAGAECLKATEELERALGKTTSDTKTREFNDRATQTQQQRQSNR